MAQMVLPQNLVPGAQQDSGLAKSGSDKETSRSDSRFESVSRAEQKRLDQKKADRAEESKSADASQNVEDASANANVGSESTRKSGEASAGSKKVSGKTGEEVSENATPIASPLTFADLQALLVPATGQAMANGSTPGKFSTPGMLTQTISGNGLAGGMLNGNPGSQGQGLTGLSLTDGLVSALTSDNGRSADAASLLTPGRFQGALDVATQQQTAKLPADAAAPLRGYATSIDVPVGHADWGDKMAGKLSWLTARNMSVAEIHLTPPDMGPMEVKVKLHHDQATITIHAANPVVRDQLDLNSNRLRDMLAEQGVDLAQFDVSDSPQQQGGEQAAGGQGSDGQNASGVATGLDTDEAGLNAGHLDLSWKGEVDIFA